MKRMLPRKLCVSPVLLAVVLLAAVARGDERRPINAVKKRFSSTASSTATTLGPAILGVIKTPDRFVECPDGEYFDADGVCRDDWGRKFVSTGTSTAATTASSTTVKASIGLQSRCAEGQEYREGRCQQRVSSTSRPGLQGRCPPGEAFDGQRCRKVAQSSTLRTPTQSRCAEGEAFDGQRCNAVVTPRTTSPPGKAATARKTRSRRMVTQPTSTTSVTPRMKTPTPSKKSSTPSKKASTKKTIPKAKTPRTKVGTSTTPRTQSASSRKPRLNRATIMTNCPRGQVEAKGLCVEDTTRGCVEGEVMRGGKCRLDASSKGTTPKGTTPKGTTPLRKHRCARGEAFVAGRCQAGPTPPCAAGKELLDGICKKKPTNLIPAKKLLVNLGNTQRRCPTGEAFDTEGNCRETWLEPDSE